MIEANQSTSSKRARFSNTIDTSAHASAHQPAGHPMMPIISIVADPHSQAIFRESKPVVIEDPYEAKTSNIDLNFNFWTKNAFICDEELRQCLVDAFVGRCDNNDNCAFSSHLPSSNVTVVLIKGVNPLEIGKRVKYLDFLSSCSRIPVMHLSEGSKRFPMKNTWRSMDYLDATATMLWPECACIDQMIINSLNTFELLLSYCVVFQYASPDRWSDRVCLTIPDPTSSLKDRYEDFITQKFDENVLKNASYLRMQPGDLIGYIRRLSAADSGYFLCRAGAQHRVSQLVFVWFKGAHELLYGSFGNTGEHNFYSSTSFLLSQSQLGQAASTGEPVTPAVLVFEKAVDVKETYSISSTSEATDILTNKTKPTDSNTQSEGSITHSSLNVTSVLQYNPAEDLSRVEFLCNSLVPHFSLATLSDLCIPKSILELYDYPIFDYGSDGENSYSCNKMNIEALSNNEFKTFHSTSNRTWSEGKGKVRLSSSNLTLSNSTGTIIRDNIVIGSNSITTKSYRLSSLKQEKEEGEESSSEEETAEQLAILIESAGKESHENSLLTSDSDMTSSTSKDLHSSIASLHPSPLMVCAIDCEMCTTALGRELARVSIVALSVGETGRISVRVVYDKLVKPLNKIIDYLSDFSGITEEMLSNVKFTLDDVIEDLRFLIDENTIVIGHSLESDLKALKLSHRKVIDTSILYPHSKGYPYRNSLRGLSQDYLKISIQQDAKSKSSNSLAGTAAGELQGHDSIQDACIALELAIMKLMHVNNRSFGISPINTNSEITRTSIVDQIQKSINISEGVRNRNNEIPEVNDFQYNFYSSDYSSALSDLHLKLSVGYPYESMSFSIIDYLASKYSSSSIIAHKNNYTNSVGGGGVVAERSVELPLPSPSGNASFRGRYSSDSRECLQYIIELNKSRKSESPRVRNFNWIDIVLHHFQDNNSSVNPLATIDSSLNELFESAPSGELFVIMTENDSQTMRQLMGQKLKSRWAQRPQKDTNPTSSELAVVPPPPPPSKSFGSLLSNLSGTKRISALANAPPPPVPPPAPTISIPTSTIKPQPTWTEENDKKLNALAQLNILSFTFIIQK